MIEKDFFKEYLESKLKKPIAYMSDKVQVVKEKIINKIEQKILAEKAKSGDSSIVEKKEEPNTIETKSEDEKSLDEDEEEVKRYINLQIKLDSWSPVYEKFGIKYKEKIAIDAFDKEVPIEEQHLNCYVDHDISIEKMIASTIDGSMVVKKSENSIEAKVKVDENDSLAKKTADLIERKIVKSNSFIFEALDVEQKWYEEETKKDVDLEIIYKVGKLISIDPVYRGFFPQCETHVEKKEIKGETNMLENKIEKIEAIETEKKEVATATKIEIEDIINKRMESNIGLIKQALAKEVEAKPIKFEEVRDKWLNRKPLTEEENKVLYRDYLELKKDSELRNDTTFLKSIDYSNATSNQILNTYGLISKALDGTTKEKGLALIEVLTAKNIISEWMGVFPELTDFATILPIIGLNKVQQPVLIPDKATVSKINEGAKSIKQGGQTTNVEFQPDRYSVELDQNNQLNSFSSTLAKQTLTVQDNIREGLRKDFYTNMFKNVKANLNLSTYDGGATMESVRTTATANTLTLADVDAVVNELYAKWGESATNGYVISMHVKILQHLENEYFTSGNSLWKDIYNPTTRTFRGIKIIPLGFTLPTTDNMKDTVATNNHVIAFFLKSAVVAYGCSFVIQDSIYEMMSEDLFTRFIRLRGQIKMCDPHLNTRILKVK